MPSRAAACSGRSSRWPKSPKWTTRTPSRSKAKIVFGPRSVPAEASCSEATADHLADWRLQLARGGAQDGRLARDRLGAVVVDVLVGDQQEVDVVLLDRRIAEFDTAIRKSGHVGERIDEDLRPIAGQGKG